MINMGDNAFNNGNYPDALHYYNQVLQQDNSNTLILSKIGNTYYAMQMYPTSQYFYEEALTKTDAYTIIYQYALNPMQPPDIYTLRENLIIHYNLDIIPEGLELIISNIQQENQEKPITPYIDIKRALPWEQLATTLFKKAGLPLFGEIFDLVHQFKHLTTNNNINQKTIILSKRISWTQFENFLQNFFELKGYQVTRTKKSHDYGADLILIRPWESIVVQAKKTKNTVGVKAVQEIYTAKSFYQTQKAILITTSHFSKPALKLAEKIGVTCWDWEQLLKQIQKT